MKLGTRWDVGGGAGGQGSLGWTGTLEGNAWRARRGRAVSPQRSSPSAAIASGEGRAVQSAPSHPSRVISEKRLSKKICLRRYTYMVGARNPFWASDKLIGDL